jgi:hypothetical protein
MIKRGFGARSLAGPNQGAPNVKRTRLDSSRKPGPMEREQWLVATCQACKKAIDQAAGRIMVAALKFEPEGNYDPSGSHVSRVSVVEGILSAGEGSSWKVGKLISYCNGCAQGIDDFLISNPWSLRKRAATKAVNGSASLETCVKAPAAGAPETVSGTLAHNDTRGVHSTNSIPVKSDLTALPVQMERIAAKSAAGKLSGQVLETTSEIANEPVAVHSGNAGTAGNSSPGEEKQRAKLLKFLNAPTSQGMRPQMRQVGRSWAEGCSKGDVARKLNMDPSIVGRMINGALKMADARG